MTDRATPDAPGANERATAGSDSSPNRDDRTASTGDANLQEGSGNRHDGDASGEGGGSSANRRRRGSRGGRNRNNKKPAGDGGDPGDTAEGRDPGPAPATKPKIGDTRPAPAAEGGQDQQAPAAASGDETPNKKRRRRRRGGSGRGSGGSGGNNSANNSGNNSGGNRGGQRSVTPVTAFVEDAPIELDEATLELRKGQERKGQAVGRYSMVVHSGEGATQIAILEGRSLIEYYVSRPADDVTEIHGNVYLGKVQNVLPGMEAAFIDIGTPKNAVLYRGDVAYDKDELDKSHGAPRIEQMLRNKQTILCQVTKNPIAHKGARLTQEVSLPGRFVVLVPNSDTYGISKRLPDKERKRLRQILDRAKPKQHGVIVRTAAEDITAEEIERDVARLVRQWEGIENLASSAKSPSLLYREPEMAMRVIREEFNKEFRSVLIDDQGLFEEVADYVLGITPALADRVQFHDNDKTLALFEEYHVYEQLVKALDRKVWLPSGGSLIIEHTEALTVIDVNTGKNVGRSSLEETVTRNNVEAAREVARQLRLRDIGGIIVIDFVDMEEKRNRDEVMRVFREALGRDKTRTQVFDISDLGLVEMTRKRIGEGLLESFAQTCANCNGLGHTLDDALLDSPIG